MEFEDFELQLGPRIGEDLHLRVLRSPAGEAECLVPFPPALSGGRFPTFEEPVPVGSGLFRSLFAGAIGELFHASLRATGDQRGLRLRLRINPRQADLAPLHRAPWELLYREATADFLALGRRTPIVRTFDVPRPAILPPFEPPLRILVVRSLQPHGEPLGLDQELAALTRRLGAHPAIEVEILDDPDPQALRDALLARPFHALHYMGHGFFDPETGAGMLLWRGARGARMPLHGRHLATKLKDLGSLRLVVLNACDTALSGGESGQDPFAGVASALVLGGLPAVVAMQSPIEDRAAIAFSTAFYDRLAHGRTVEEAVTEGRQAIHSLRPDATDWAVPVLFLRTPDGDLFAGAAAADPAPITLDEPSPRQQSLSRRRAGAGIIAVLTLAAGSIYLVKNGPWDSMEESPRHGEGQGSESAVSTEVKAIDHPVDKPAGQQVAPAPKFVPAARSTTRSITLGEGDQSWRLRITGDPRVIDSFCQTLRRAGALLPGFGSPGGTIRIEVSGPSVTDSTTASLPGTRCQLHATLRGARGSFTVPPVSIAQGNEISACEMAAESLANAVANKLADFVEEIP